MAGAAMTMFLILALSAADSKALLSRFASEAPDVWERTYLTLGRSYWKGNLTTEVPLRPASRIELDVVADVPGSMHRILREQRGKPPEWMVLNPQYRFRALRAGKDGVFRVDDV